MKLALPLAVVLVGAVALIISLTAFAGGAPPATATTPPCVTSGPVSGLSATAAANARVVTAVSGQLGGAAAAVIAVMTGYTESGLLSLGNPSTPGGNSLVQGIGDDHDSVGIFQQRASWGPAAQRLDPVQSTRLFVTHLLAEPGWRNQPPWAAAQRVQGSAWDGDPRPANHDSSVAGGNYRANLGLARRVVAEIDQDAVQHPCGALVGGLPANPAPGSHGLPAGYVIPATADAAQAQVVLFAIAQLGKPYVFGAAGPGAYDCSGLVLAAWRQAGVQLPHSAALQAEAGTPTTVAALVPGDLIAVPGDDGTLAAPGHIGIYLGDGLVINAADPTDGIRVQTYANFVEVGHGLSALRHLE